MLAGAGLLAAAAAGVLHRDEIGGILEAFVRALDTNPYGMLEFWLAYVALEMLAVPAVPLTLAAGALFGTEAGVAIISTASLTAASAAFLLARYTFRERVVRMLSANTRWAAVDRVLGANSFRVILLLRLSPLFPFALSNYFFGCSSLRFTPYVLGSWLGMLPGTVLYVSAGGVGREVAEHGLAGADDVSKAALVGGLVLAFAGGTFGTRLVQEAMAEAEKAEAAAKGDILS